MTQLCVKHSASPPSVLGQCLSPAALTQAGLQAVQRGRLIVTHVTEVTIESLQSQLMFSVCQSIRHWNMGKVSVASTGARLCFSGHDDFTRDNAERRRQSPALLTIIMAAPSIAGGGFCLVSDHHQCSDDRMWEDLVRVNIKWCLGVLNLLIDAML